jgi:integrase
MSVRKRKWTTSKGEAKEAWIVDYVDQDGDRHIETFERKKDADAFHATVRVDVGKGEHIAPSKSETIAEAAERWIKRVEANGRERGTLRQYRQHIDLHISPRIGSIKLAHLTGAKVEAFRDDLLKPKSEDGLSRALARKVLTSLKSILKVAKRGQVAADVSIGRDKRKHRLEAGKDFPTPDQAKRLLEAAAEADIRPRTLLIMAIFTGLRASELRGLRWKDVDLKHNEIHVRQRADRFNAIGAPKSETSVRKISFDSRVLAALKEWKLACPKGEADLVFPTAEGRVQQHRDLLYSLNPIMAAAKMVEGDGEPKYGLHAMRHFYASWCINRKADGGRELPAKNVQQLLGHSSIVITMDTYGHLFPASNDRAELEAASAALWA